MNRIVLLTVAVGLMVGADEPKKVADEDPGRLQGSWAMQSITMDGLVVPSAYTRTGRLVIEGDSYRLTLDDQTIVSTFRLDSGKSPRQVDFTFTEGPQKGQTVQGIYEVDGDSLRICRGMRPAVERPREFAAPSDSGLILLTYKRAPGSR
jgi:uncharacterized protein (TIGR03067 family)